MKLFTFLLALWPSIVFSQSFPQLVALYEKECAELVNDTINQYGEIRYELVPVIDQGGKILHYALGKPDTVWETPDCPKFKVAAHNGISFGNGRSGIYFGDNISYSSTLGFNPAPYPIGNTKTEKTVVEISRKYVRQIKRREVEPFSEHFWDWLKNRKDEQ